VRDRAFKRSISPSALVARRASLCASACARCASTSFGPRGFLDPGKLGLYDSPQGLASDGIEDLDVLTVRAYTKRGLYADAVEMALCIGDPGPVESPNQAVPAEREAALTPSRHRV